MCHRRASVDQLSLDCRRSVQRSGIGEATGALSESRVTRPERLKPDETAAIFCWWEGDFTTGIRRYQRRLSKALEF